MKIEQLYTKCLAQGAYYIESNGEVAIIDPLREVQQYITKAQERGAKIKYIFETHFHADFVSGHVDLSQKTGAPIIFGPTTASTGFDCTIAQDGQVFQLGNTTLTLIHTPGHTLESSCILLKDENQTPISLFTGDTLFIGDVGRPDLAQHINSDLTQEKLASHLFESLHNKIMTLPDSTIIYPGHGAGSACGKNMSNETSDTLGNQKKTNYALNSNLTKEQFIQEVTAGLLPPPSYFPKNVLLNIGGYQNIDEVIQKGTTPLSIDAFLQVQQQKNAIIIDTRDPEIFAQGFIPGSINIGLSGTFAVWVGTIIPNIQQPILIVANPGTVTEVVTRLARVGYDQAQGYLDATISAYAAIGQKLDKISTISAQEYLELTTQQQLNSHHLVTADQPKINTLDVRRTSEFDAGHLPNATNIPLDYINSKLSQLPKDQTYYVHCAGGYRSMIFISYAQQQGYKNLVNINGGYAKLHG